MENLWPFGDLELSPESSTEGIKIPDRSPHNDEVLAEILAKKKIDMEWNKFKTCDRVGDSRSPDTEPEKQFRKEARSWITEGLLRASRMKSIIREVYYKLHCFIIDLAD